MTKKSAKQANPTAEIHADFADFILRLSEHLEKRDILGQLGPWICENTEINGQPFNFTDHEFQIAIANDPHPNMAVKKCSQVGLSELAVRITLALMSLRKLTAIYTLPSAGFAGTFSKSRIHVVIEQSPKLRALVRAGAMSVGLIQLMNSFLHVKGSASASQAISVPAQLLVNDEFDFSNQNVLTSFNSRLRHAEGGGVRKKFSTPTVDGYGITRLVEEQSDNKKYLCKCIHCNTWQVPLFTRQIVIPGFDKEFKEFSRDMLRDERFDIRKTYMRCISCGLDLWPSIILPEQREWVAEFPSRHDMSGYQVKPFDLPKYNTPLSVLQQLDEYERTQDYHNFVLGETYASHENQIDLRVVQSNTKLPWAGRGVGMMMGVDVGKNRVHVTIGKKVDKKYKIFALYTLHSFDGPFEDQLAKLFTDYGCYRAVIDSEPDFTLCRSFREKSKEVYFCVYVRNKAGKVRSYWTLDENESSVMAQRTRGFDAYVSDINHGVVEFPICAEMKEVCDHLMQVKRIEEVDEEDNKIAKWTKISSADHYFHSGFYFRLACDMEDRENANQAIPAPTSISGINLSRARQETDVRISSSSAANTDQLSMLRELAGHFRIR